jgi:hypothetical protein
MHHHIKRLLAKAIKQAEAYDPLFQAQKHIMLKNGAFEFVNIPNGKCRCGDLVSEHLDYVDCCLFAKKNEELCICYRFLREDGAPVKISKRSTQKQETGQEDLKLSSYIQTLARI